MGIPIRREFAVFMASLTWLVCRLAMAEVAPVLPQPGPDSLQPGLAVSYYYDFYRSIDNVIAKMEKSDGVNGAPLPALNYRVGTGIVLSADRNDGVGAHITGLIRLAESGDYFFAIESNDGVLLRISGETLIEDPNVHADQWSSVATVTVTEPGWYPIELLYFERRNTSTLRLVWKPPAISESGKFKPVPEEVFAHLASE